MATLEFRNHPNERLLIGTVTLKISGNNFPEKTPEGHPKGHVLQLMKTAGCICSNLTLPK